MKRFLLFLLLCLVLSLPACRGYAFKIGATFSPPGISVGIVPVPTPEEEKARLIGALILDNTNAPEPVQPVK